LIEEVHLFGVYLPAALAWAVLAFLLAYLLRNLLGRLPLQRLLWHPALADLALFALLWWTITDLADRFTPAWLVS
jgi:hypothetical protein